MKTIFVSSTFKDMHFERDAIQEITLPALKAQAIKYGESVSFCDLRWGINTGNLDSEEGSRKVLDVCLDEIDRCKPPMVVILGDRYGWIPSEALTKSAAERKRIELEDLQVSVTALEIAYGALSTPERCRQTLFYFRHIESDCPSDYSVEDLEHENKLNLLKDKIEKLTGGRVKHYYVRWDGEKLDGVITFAKMLAKDIEEVLLPEWKKKELLTPFERERMTHWSFISEKNEMFSSRGTLVQKFFDILTQNKKKFLAIKALSGSGKSMLFSNLALKLRESGYDVLPFVSGLTAESNDSIDIIRNTIYYLEELLGFSHKRVEFVDTEGGDKQKEKIDGTDKLRERLTELCLECESAGKRVIIMVDAVDQLAPDVNRDNLVFIPERLSDSVKFVMTCLPELNTAGRDSVSVKPIDNTEKREVIDGILKSHNRELEDKVIQRMIKTRSSDNPLFLSLLVQRLLMMNRDDFIAIKKAGDGMKAISQHQLDVIASCPDSLQKMSAALLNEAGKRINDELVRTVAEYLAVSRHGMRQEDLAALLGDKWSALDFAHFITYMDEDFIQRDDGRFDFSHKCIREGFLESCADINKIHTQILNYFDTLPLNDTVRMQESVYHMIAINDRVRFASYILTVKDHGVASETAAKTLFAHSMTDGGKWFCDFLENAQNYGAYGYMCRFVNEYFDRNISGTLEEMKMRMDVLNAGVSLAHKISGTDASERTAAADTYVHYAKSRKRIDIDSYNAFSMFPWEKSYYYEKAFDIYNSMPDLSDDEVHIAKMVDICTYFDGFHPYVNKGISIAKKFLEKKRNIFIEADLARLYLRLPSNESLGSGKFSHFVHSMEIMDGIENGYSEIPTEVKEKMADVYLELAKRHPFKNQKNEYLKKYIDIKTALAGNTETLNGKLYLADAYSRCENVFNSVDDMDGVLDINNRIIDLYRQIYDKYCLESSLASAVSQMCSLGRALCKKEGALSALEQNKKAVLYLLEQLKDGDELFFYQILWILDEFPGSYSYYDTLRMKLRVAKNIILLFIEAIANKGKFVKIKYPMWRAYGEIADIFYRFGVGDKFTYRIKKALIKNDIRRAVKTKGFKWAHWKTVADEYGRMRDLCLIIGGAKYNLKSLHYAKKAISIQKKAIRICAEKNTPDKGIYTVVLAGHYRELGYCLELLGIKKAAEFYYKKEISIHERDDIKKISPSKAMLYMSNVRLANLYYQKGMKNCGDAYFEKYAEYKTSPNDSKHIFCIRWDGGYWSARGSYKVYGFIEEHPEYKNPAENMLDPTGNKRIEDALERITETVGSLESLMLLRNSYRKPYWLGAERNYPEFFIKYYEKCVDIDRRISERYTDFDCRPMKALDYNDLMLLNLMSGNYEEALRCGSAAKSIFEDILDKNGSYEYKEDLSTVYRNISEVHDASGVRENLALAKEYLEKNISLDEELYYEGKLKNPYITLMLSYRRMALMHERAGDFEKAKHFHGKAFDILSDAKPSEEENVFKGTMAEENMCFISNLIEAGEKTYLSAEERRTCYEKSIDRLNLLNTDQTAPWNFNAPMIIRSLKKRICELNEGGIK